MVLNGMGHNVWGFQKNAGYDIVPNFHFVS